MTDGVSQYSWPPDVAEIDAELVNYHVLEAAGFDPCGAVFTARDTRMNRLVSVRVLPPPATSAPDFFQRFTREIETVSEVRHPNLAGILDHGVTEGRQHFLVAEFVEGHDLGAIIKSGTVTTSHVDGWMPQLLGALEAIHGAGGGHGWLNPSLVRIEPSGNLRVTGFGIASIADVFGGASPMNAAFQAFVAPECTRPGSRGDQQSDLYAAGVLFYQMLTGTVPQGIFHPPSLVAPDLDTRYDAAVARALEGNRSARFQSAAEFRVALGAERAPSPVLNAPIPEAPCKLSLGGPGRMGRPLPRKTEHSAPVRPIPAEKTGGKGFWWAVTLVLLLGIGLIFFALNKDRNNKKTAGSAPESKPAIEGTILAPVEEAESSAGAELPNVAEAGELLVKLQELRYFDPELAALIRSNERLAALVRDGQMSGKRHPELLSEAEFRSKLMDYRRNARLPAPVRKNKPGTLMVWPANGKSEPVPAKDQIADFLGQGDEIVEIAGRFDDGIAVTVEGRIVSWGTSLKPPAMKGIATVDCEKGHFGALTEDGEVAVWGVVSEGEAEIVATWEDISKIAVGGAHLLAVTRDFKLKAAGSNDSRQTEIPGGIRRYEIVAIAAEGDRSAALSADGTLFQWGGKSEPDEKTQPRLLDIEFQHGKLIGVDLGGRVIGGLEKWEFEPLGLAGGGGGVRTIPRMAPAGDQFALQKGGSRWLFSGIHGLPGKGFHTAFCEKSARGSVDLILGEDSVLAVVPDPKAPGNAPKIAAGESPLPMLTIDDISVPANLAYREWSPAGGVKKRARLLAFKDKTHLLLRFADGTDDATIPLARFSGLDKAFVSRWTGMEAIADAWLEQETVGLSLDEFLKGSGFVSVDFRLSRSGPVIEGLAKSGAAVQPIRMLVDTGATISLLDLSFGRRLGIPLRPSKVRGWQGLIPAGQGNLESLRFGDFVVGDVEMLFVDLKRLNPMLAFDGLLGIDVLRNAEVAFDFGMMNLLFHQEATPGAEPGMGKSAFREWRNADGKSIRAKLARIPEKTVGMISIEKPDGSVFEMPKSTLSDRDREYLDLHAVRTAHQQRRHRFRLGDFLQRDPDAWETIGYQIQNDQPIVTIQVDGRDLQFFVDTGARFSMLSEEAARNLGRNIDTLQIEDFAGGLDGKVTPVRYDDFGKVQIGSRALFDFRMRVYDFKYMTKYRDSGTPHDGVLGVDLLERFEAIIDHETKRVILPVFQ